MAETKLIRDHHLLTRNLKLNDNYISNDGGDEGITVSDAGLVELHTAGGGGIAVHNFGTDNYTLKFNADAKNSLNCFLPSNSAGF